MEMDQILNETRNRYLNQFIDALTNLEANGQQSAAEAAFRNEQGGLAEEGALSLPMRGDIFLIKDGQPSESMSVDSESLFAFEPLSLVFGDILPVEIAPFYWDGCNIYVSGISEQADWSLLVMWFAKWFDFEDRGNIDGEGFLGVIHFLSDPKFDGSKTGFQVDFGSAPVEAFRELLDTLKACGATKVEIGGT
jgi:hypothetical protein